MTNSDISKLFHKITAAMTIKNENRFKIIAYEKAADVIEKSMIDLKALWKDGKLDTIPGIGSSISSHLQELFTTGKVAHFEAILSDISPAVFPLLDIPGFGPKKAYKLVTTLKLHNPDTVVEDIANAVKEGRVEQIEGFGAKSAADIVKALGKFKKGRGSDVRMPLPYAHEIASKMIDYIKRAPETKEAVFLGSLRRMVSTIGDIDLAVSTNAPEKIIELFISYPGVSEIVDRGPVGATVLLANGKQVDLRVQTPEKFGAMVQYFTGSKYHNVHLREFALKQGLSLNEYGIKPLEANSLPSLNGKKLHTKEGLYEFSSEEDFYEAIGLPWIPPELREDRGEIEAALTGTLPDLVDLADIKGDFHIHSNYDLSSSHDLGVSSLEELLDHAQRLGYQYIGISDHNPKAAHSSEKEIVKILKRRKEYFEHIMSTKKSVRVHLFTMLETDIQVTGSLAIPDEAFEYLDASIVSIHSNFGMERDAMTDRILKGLSHPKAKILAHPTGRLLGSREGYEVDWERLFAFCLIHNKAVEINSFPERLDLSDVMVREAISKGVKLVISTDSHASEHMELMKYGISVARRGWATKHDILNTMEYNQLCDWLLNPS